MPKHWLVTGSTKGLGRAIVEHALAQGDKVLATGRDPKALELLEARYPRTLRTFRLDVTDAAQAAAAVDAAIAAFGRLDVLVNNAGYARIAPFEQTDPASFRDQIETNLFGVVNLTRAVLPIMRAQREGTIINISSVGGRVGAPGLGAYQSAKWAVSGFTEAVAQELAPFGVRMIAVEPGGMRTEWGRTAHSQPLDLLPEYQSTVGAMLDMMERFVGNEVGDPAKIAQVVFDLSRTPALPAHLLLGSDALHVFERADAARQQAAAAWRDVSRSTDFDAVDAAHLSGSQFE
ncbi:SDR family oxidoreductase [Sphingomonas sp. TDK1]|uniref:SDR family oxidoreductase n=1 Tax=Sphingomonas sp. TDK1 TaxID=453247 RepID=UPI0007DA1F7F|nr:SDR family oxidoreductase [Sphingomonas sp. TDK1]OAN66588.1 short-chain dehydrogenase/reductase [Sphingomonas sp. TDK1]